MVFTQGSSFTWYSRVNNLFCDHIEIRLYKRLLHISFKFIPLPLYILDLLIFFLVSQIYFWICKIFGLGQFFCLPEFFEFLMQMNFHSPNKNVDRIVTPNQIQHQPIPSFSFDSPAHLKFTTILN